MSSGRIYSGITAVTAELAELGVPKERTHPVEGYRYRSIDDLLAALAPLLAKHRVCIFPRVLDRQTREKKADGEATACSTVLRVAFDFVSAEDGSRHVAKVVGEALDPTDKGSSKALTAAYKNAVVQTFCIPSGISDDPEKPGVSPKSLRLPEPPQGWILWGAEIQDIVRSCETEAAIQLVQERNRDLLMSVGREMPSVYRDLGAAFERRREEIRSRLRLARRNGAGRRSAKSSKRDAEHV
jgi:hypothetical protein